MLHWVKTLILSVLLFASITQPLNAAPLGGSQLALHLCRYHAQANFIVAFKRFCSTGRRRPA